MSEKRHERKWRALIEPKEKPPHGGFSKGELAERVLLTPKVVPARPNCRPFVDRKEVSDLFIGADSCVSDANHGIEFVDAQFANFVAQIDHWKSPVGLGARPFALAHQSIA